MDILIAVAAATLLLVPGMLLWAQLNGPDMSAPMAVTGLSVSLGIGVLSLHILAQIRLELFLAVWIVLGFVLIWKCGSSAWESLSRSMPSIGRPVLFLGAVLAVYRFLPTFAHDNPHGWDPYFHLLVVDLIETSGMAVRSLSPYEEIPIRYPMGSHLLVAATAFFPGVTAEGAYKALLALVGTLTVLQVWAWVRVSTANDRWSLYAMACFGFLAVLGSMGYYGWGGLPNLIGMYVFAGCLTIICDEDSPAVSWHFLPVLYLAILVLNHHVVATAFFVLTAILCSLLLRGRVSEARRLAAGGVVASLCGLPFVWLRMRAESSSLHDTGLLLYGEPLHTLLYIVGALGAVFFFSLLVGFGLWVRKRRDFPIAPSMLTAVVALLALFVTFEYGGRVVMTSLFDRNIGPFTPSRFLTDAVYPLSLFAGFAFYRLEALTKRSLVPVVVLLAAVNFGAYRSYFGDPVSAGRAEAYEWIAAHTRSDTWVVDRFVQTAVLTKRVSSYMALPSSELWTRAVNRQLGAQLMQGDAPPELAETPMVRILDAGESFEGFFEVLWDHATGVRVVDVNPTVPAAVR